MKRLAFVVLGACVLASGCKDSRVDPLILRVTELETKHAALAAEHDRTREKLQALLVWVNTKKPDGVGLVDWMATVNELCCGPSDPVLPSAPPPPF